MFFDERNISEKVSAKNKESTPQQSTDNIVEGKGKRSHFSDAGDKRGKGPDDRYESGGNDGFRAVLLIKCFGPHQIFFVEEQRFFFFENSGTKMFSYIIID